MVLGRLANSLTEILFKKDATVPSHREGRLFYDVNDHTLALFNDVSAVTHQLGQESLMRVFNNTGVAIPNGAAVYHSSFEVVEGRPTVALAQADAAATSLVIGLATHDIPDQTFGYVTMQGLVNNLDTSALTAPNTLYLSESTPGGFRDSVPPEGNHIVVLGYLIRADAAIGRVLVSVFLDQTSRSGRVPFRYETSAQQANKVFFETNSATYESAVQFVFPGTDLLTVPPNKANFVASAGQDGSSSGLRLFDVTNGLTIAETDPVTTNQLEQIIDLGTVANLPATASLFEVQAKKNAGGTARVSYANLVRE